MRPCPHSLPAEMQKALPAAGLVACLQDKRVIAMQPVSEADARKYNLPAGRWVSAEVGARLQPAPPASLHACIPVGWHGAPGWPPSALGTTANAGTRQGAAAAPGALGSTSSCFRTSDIFSQP